MQDKKIFEEVFMGGMICAIYEHRVLFLNGDNKFIFSFEKMNEKEKTQRLIKVLKEFLENDKEFEISYISNLNRLIIFNKNNLDNKYYFNQLTDLEIVQS